MECVCSSRPWATARRQSSSPTGSACATTDRTLLHGSDGGPLRDEVRGSPAPCRAIRPLGPYHGKHYPTHLTNADATLRDAFAKLAELQKERASHDPKDFCRKFWSVLRVIYVADPADAGKVKWDRCDLPNELGFMRYWTEHLLPSIQGLNLAAEEVAKVKEPVLTIHGTKDRSAPYGGGREWALMLPNARLVTVEKAAHAPWIEAPRTVFGAIKTFLDGRWPRSAEKVV